METKQKSKLQVIDNRIFGNRKETSKLYLIMWERIANNGMVYGWAESEDEAYELYGFSLNTAVRHTIVEINPDSMPVTDNREAL